MQDRWQLPGSLPESFSPEAPTVGGFAGRWKLSKSHAHPSCEPPLLPVEVLKAHDAYEEYDTRFRACARLLQSLWRSAHGLGAGTRKTRKGGVKRTGSRLHPEAALEGRNFLSPDLAQLAVMERAYQERGALIEPERLFGNLLSSMPMAFNVAGPWSLDHELAKSVLDHLLPDVSIAKVIEVRFEHSPRRVDPAFTHDRSALDVAVVFERPDGKPGLIGFEFKYSEDPCDGRKGQPGMRFTELATQSGLFKEPTHAALSIAPFEQLSREHVLCHSAVARRLYAEAHFVLLAPRQNARFATAQERYTVFLADPESGSVPFHYVELEDVIAAFAASGDAHYATLLFERYCDWSQLDRLIHCHAESNRKDWSLKPLGARPPLKLVSGGVR